MDLVLNLGGKLNYPSSFVVAIVSARRAFGKLLPPVGHANIHAANIHNLVRMYAVCMFLYMLRNGVMIHIRIGGQRIDRLPVGYSEYISRVRASVRYLLLIGSDCTYKYI